MIYTIKKDKNNDTRFRIPDVFTGKFKKTWKVSLSPECWYPKELGYNQINKLVGVTEFWSANNKNSVMVGWEPCYLPEEEILAKYPHCHNRGKEIVNVKYFNVYYYTNDNKGGHEATFVTVIADWRINDVSIFMQKINNEIHTDVSIVQFSGEETPGSNYIYAVANSAGAPFAVRTDLMVNRVMINPFKTTKNLFREIFLWFGGTKPAPWDMLFKVN